MRSMKQEKVRVLFTRNLLEGHDMGLRTVDGIAEIEDHRRAWFKDSEGNVLVLSEKV